MAANWLELQTEILFLILKRLTFLDIIRFKSVCYMWNKATRSYISSPFYSPILTPLLMLPNDVESNARNFFSVTENKYYKINHNVFEEFSNAWCIGSSHGWLIIFHERENSYLVNPISGVKIHLPLMNNLNMPRDDLRGYKYCISKAILLSNPCLGESEKLSFCVVVIYGQSSKTLAFCRSEDSTWTQFGDEGVYQDMICHNGLLYVFSFTNPVEIWDFHSDFPKKVMELEISSALNALVEHPNYMESYLVESMGELLYVVEMQTNEEETIREFAICKLLDDGEERWEPVETLSDRALFLGKYESISVSTQNCLEGVGENLIYFTLRKDYSIGGHSIGVYNFKEKEMVNKQVYDHYCMIVDDDSPFVMYDPPWPLFWIVPNPW
ncbi:probable F-box protein At4g22060 [Ziziphus jujuba]|uniref:Probable F-box protein At4g22060 n=1 Tax=Ziziphus jujuba TaxID=326968 RepID=A0ABM4A561_ZIZJJ|nr:probable F-box protein At4g22060 [Ziziphus jujuba]